MVQTRKAIHSSSIKAIKRYCHSDVIMNEEKLTKKAEVFITVDNFIAITILMAVLIRKTKLATTIQKTFLFFSFFNISFTIKDRNL